MTDEPSQKTIDRLCNLGERDNYFKFQINGR